MNQIVRTRPAPVRMGASACPHDCPSTCALEVEIVDERTIGRVRGAQDNGYTAGVVCAKVARYAERAHHPDRLTVPLLRRGAKGSGELIPVSWDAALDLVAERFLRAQERHGAQAVWPYYYAGTMGLVMRDGIHRLRHAKKYSGFHSSICVNPAFSGFAAGTGRVAGPDPREMAKSDLVVIWGTNAACTQVNVMKHAVRARKERGAKLVAVDIYMNSTMEQADLPVLIRPGTDGALACAVMHCLFRDGRADWDYLDRYTDAPGELEQHLRARDPHWAASITGCPAATIEAFARLAGKRNTRGNRRLAARRRRRLPQQSGHLSLEQEDDRRERHARPRGAHARSVAHRRDPLWRRSGARRRAAGHCDADPEHQSAVGGAGAGARQARLRARRPVRVRARAVSYRDRAHGRCGAAGHDVCRARRHLPGRRPPAHSARAQARRAARAVPLQSRGHLCARRAAWRKASRLCHDRARADRLDAA